MFSLSGRQSEISVDIFPTLDLTQGEWEIGLIDLYTYNTIPNIETGVNDTIYFGDDRKGTEIPSREGDVQVITSRQSNSVQYNEIDSKLLDMVNAKDNRKGVAVILPEGSYEITDIEKHIIAVCERSKIPLESFQLKPNNVTLRSEIFSSREIDFVRPGSIGPLLGFNPRVLSANKWHISDNQVSIIRVNVIRVTCNIARGAYKDGVEGHTLHEFYPRVPPGFKVVEAPKNVIYLPVNTKRVHNITIRLEDQHGKCINFRNEEISVRLHLRRRDN